MIRRDRFVLITLLLLTDTLATGLALVLAYWVRIGSGWLPYHAPMNWETYSTISLLSLPIWLLLYTGQGLYDPRNLLGGLQEYVAVLKACVAGVIVLVLISFAQRSEPLSRGWLLLGWVLTTLFVSADRFAMRRLIYRLRSRGWFVVPVIVAGANDEGRAVASQLARSAGVQMLGFLDDYLPPGTQVLDGQEVLGSPGRLPEILRTHPAREVVVVPGALSWESFQEIIEYASHNGQFDLHMAPGFYEILASGVRVSNRGFVPLMRVEGVRLVGADALLKTLLDFGLGVVLFLTSLPLMALIGLWIWRRDGRPIFARYPVLGLRGVPFRTIKFRTGFTGATRRCLADPDSMEAYPAQVGTRVGRLLYTTGLDKLPQLLDVLRGKMSLVGPRTIDVDRQHLYGRWLPMLLSVNPGMVGPWTVNPVPTLDEEIRQTIYYIRTWTVWADLHVLVQTFRRILRRQRPEVTR